MTRSSTGSPKVSSLPLVKHCCFGTELLGYLAVNDPARSRSPQPSGYLASASPRSVSWGAGVVVRRWLYGPASGLKPGRLFDRAGVSVAPLLTSAIACQPRILDTDSASKSLENRDER